MGKLQREDSRDLQRDPVEHTGQHLHVSTFPKLGKELPKRIRGNRTQHSQRAGKSTCFHQLDWKTSRLMEHWGDYTKVVEQMNPTVNTALLPSSKP